MYCRILRSVEKTHRASSGLQNWGSVHTSDDRMCMLKENYLWVQLILCRTIITVLQKKTVKDLETD